VKMFFKVIPVILCFVSVNMSFAQNNENPSGFVVGGSAAKDGQVELFSSIGHFFLPPSGSVNEDTKIFNGLVPMFTELSRAPVIAHEPITRIQVGQTLQIHATVFGETNPSMSLEYRIGGETAFATIEMAKTQNNLWIAEIPAESVTSRGVEYGIKATDPTGRKDRSPASAAYGIRVEVPTGIARNIVQRAKQYDLVSLPIDANNRNLLSKLNIGSYHSDEVRIFDIYSDSPGDDRTPFTELKNGGNLAPGEAFFLILKDSLTLNTGSGTSVNTTKELTVKLNEHWTFVGNPYNFPFPLSNVHLDTSSVAGRIYAFNRAASSFAIMTADDFLEPFGGYVVYAGQPNRVLRFIPLGTEVVAPNASSATYSWSLNISAQCRTFSDLKNLAAVSKYAQNEKDEFDYHEPPVIGDYVSVYFPHNDWETSPGKYCFDVKSDNGAGRMWDLEVSSNVNDKITIKVSDFENVPANFDIYLLDENLKVKRDMRKWGAYSLAPGKAGAARHLKLVVGASLYVDNQLADFKQLPANFELDQNYPNPFNPSTTIRYALPQASQVTIKVFNLLGEEIVALASNEYREAGYHATVWDGRNKNGSLVASGLYIYHLQAGKFSLSKKMAFLK